MHLVTKVPVEHLRFLLQYVLRLYIWYLVTSLCNSGLVSLSGIWHVILSWIQDNMVGHGSVELHVLGTLSSSRSGLLCRGPYLSSKRC